MQSLIKKMVAPIVQRAIVAATGALVAINATPEQILAVETALVAIIAVGVDLAIGVFTKGPN